MEKTYFYNEDGERIYKLFLEEKYKVVKDLKNDNRSKVSLLDIDGKKIVLKTPTEKNKRVWQQFLSIFRGSESKREFDNYLKILKNNFLTLKPIMYFEKKSGFIVKDSFIMTEFLDGHNATLKDLIIVSEELRKIHSLGYLHGDSQLTNFLIKDKDIYVIDAKFQKNIYGSVGAAYEFIYLEESCHQEIDVYNKNTTSYKFAKLANSYFHWFGRMKKKIRGKE